MKPLGYKEIHWLTLIYIVRDGEDIDLAVCFRVSLLSDSSCHVPPAFKELEHHYEHSPLCTQQAPQRGGIVQWVEG